MKTILPPYLKAGNTIAITCPAGYMNAENAARCIGTLTQWGFKIIAGKTLGSKSENYFSGSDEERRNELQHMLDDKGIHAILFGRGGYGMTRIIDTLDFKKFKKNPKWLIGFSDITVLHCHLYSNLAIASIHGPMAAAFNADENDSLRSLHSAIMGERAYYSYEPHEFNKQGVATGKLVGGNLALLAHVIGTSSDFETKNRILFLEDIGEYLYNADRMLYQLKRNGKFDKLAGLVIGGFTDMKDTERFFGKTIFEIIREIISEFDFPVCYNFPVSHGEANMALKIGVEYNLLVSNTVTTLEEV
ncbi:MAG TPA: LD-carboxypeptidase [Ferruginibacter sp.]|nr:LD-carboxypeptidase [Ferruginibacter sp.]